MAARASATWPLGYRPATSDLVALFEMNHQTVHVFLALHCGAMAFSGRVFHQQHIARRQGDDSAVARRAFEFARQDDEQLAAWRAMERAVPPGGKPHHDIARRLNRLRDIERRGRRCIMLGRKRNLDFLEMAFAVFIGVKPNTLQPETPRHIAYLHGHPNWGGPGELNLATMQSCGQTRTGHRNGRTSGPHPATAGCATKGI